MAYLYPYLLKEQALCRNKLLAQQGSWRYETTGNVPETSGCPKPDTSKASFEWKVTSQTS